MFQKLVLNFVQILSLILILGSTFGISFNSIVSQAQSNQPEAALILSFKSDTNLSTLLPAIGSRSDVDIKTISSNIKIGSRLEQPVTFEITSDDNGYLDSRAVQLEYSTKLQNFVGKLGQLKGV